MTIQFQGHIESTTLDGAGPGRVSVTVCINRSTGPGPIKIEVPQEQAKEWTVGNVVHVTMYAVPPEPAK